MEQAARVVTRWRLLVSRAARERAFLAALLRSCLNHEEGARCDEPPPLPADFCIALQWRPDLEPSEGGQRCVRNDGESVPPVADQGIPPHPLYVPLAAALHRWLSAGHLRPQLPGPPGLSEDDTWQASWHDVERRVTGLGASLLKVYRSVDVEMHVQEPYFSLLRSGEKSVEGRCNLPPYDRLTPGRVLLVNNRLLLRVQAIRRFPTFRAMLAAEGLPAVLPGISSLDEGALVYRRFYAEEKERAAGVVAIHVAAGTEASTRPDSLMHAILRELGCAGVCRLLGMRRTTASLAGRLPLPEAALLAAFGQRANTGTKLTAGARSLAKHAHRSSAGWWGAIGGSEEQRNRLAEAAVRRLLSSATWLNVHSLPHELPVFEVRGPDGYGARWEADTCQFRGFLEPPMDDGHDRRWRH